MEESPESKSDTEISLTPSNFRPGSDPIPSIINPSIHQSPSFLPHHPQLNPKHIDIILFNMYNQPQASQQFGGNGGGQHDYCHNTNLCLVGAKGRYGASLDQI